MSPTLFESKSYSMPFRFFIFAFFLHILLSGCQPRTAISEQVLSDNWLMASSADIPGNSTQVAESPPDTSVWIKTKVPTTVLGALVEAGVYKDPFFGKNLEAIPRAPFEKPWWFRNTFDISDFEQDSEVLRLLLDGINYRANVWLNGTQIASQDTLFGAFRQFDLDVSNAARSGSNTLLVEVFPPQIRDFYMGFVDWAPTPPDHYMGIFREVRLRRSGKVTLDKPFVAPDLNPADLTQATVEVSAEVTNHSNEPKTVVVQGKIESITFEKRWSWPPMRKKRSALPPLNSLSLA